MEEYNARDPPFQRSKDALTSKWTKLNSECMKYNGVVARMSRDRRSGTDDMEFRNRCDVQFHTENLHKFQNYLAWEFLKDKQKWIVPDPVVVGRRNKRRETIDVDDIEVAAVDLEEPQENLAMFGPDPTPRPKGKSRKSQKSSSSSTASQSSSSTFEDRITEKFNVITHRKSRYYKERELAVQIRILSTPTENLDPVDRRIIMAQKMRIRKMLEASTLEEEAGDDGQGSGAGDDGQGSGAHDEDVDDSDEDV